MRAAKDILDALGLSPKPRMQVVSCPTCGRTRIDLCALSEAFSEAAEREGLADLPITGALMGCAVNGPGEAREADIGIAGGVGEAVLFEKGEIIGKISETEILSTLIARIRKLYVK